MEKAQVLEAITSERNHLDSLIAPLSDAQLCQPGLAGGWSVKDVLAHIAAWEKRCLDGIETGLRGGTPIWPEAGYTWQDTDRLNEETFQENKDRSLEDVQTESRKSYEQFLALVERLSDEDLNDPQRFPWTEGESILAFIADNSYNHYREHSEQIRAWLADQTMQA